MNLKQLIITVLLATTICWGIWCLIVFQIDPADAGYLGFFLFYVSIFFSLLGTFFLITFAVRKITNKLAMEYRIVSMSFRQSFFFALTGVSVLFLQSKGLLTWWNILLLVLSLGILEFFFLSFKRQV